MQINTKSFPGYSAGAAIEPRRILKIGASSNLMVHAAAATDILVAVSPADVSYEIGESIDAYFGDVVEVEAGGPISNGDRITSDSVGRGIATTTASNQYIGFALGGPYVLGDAFSCIINRGIV